MNTSKVFWWWIKLLFLARFPVFLGLILALLVLFALFLDPELLKNPFVLDTPWQLFNLTWLSMLSATWVLISFRLIRLKADERFAVSRPAPQTSSVSQNWWLWWLFLLAIGLPTPIGCIWLIHQDALSAGSEPTPVLLYVVALFAGLAFTFLLLFVLTAVQLLLLHPDVPSSHLLPFESLTILQRFKTCRIAWLYPVTDWLARRFQSLGPGYSQDVRDKKTDKEFKVLAPGHIQVFGWFGVAFLGYVASYLLVFRHDWIPTETSPFPALFFVLLSLLVFASLSTGLSFLLDYYHIPVLLILIVVSFVFYQFSHTDHYYDLNPDKQPKAETKLPRPILNFADVMDKRTFPAVVPQKALESGRNEKKRTLVVVLAAGGGIQASAWTAQVLTGLDEIYGSDFTRSIGVISAVSGGSLGTMYFVAIGDWSGTPFDETKRHLAREMSRASSLEAVGWGLAFPDTMRFFMPFLMDPSVDRGWAIEQAWRRQLDRLPDLADGRKHGDLRLRDWVEPTSRGQMPVVIFNATLVETGQRLVISPVRGYPNPEYNAADPNEYPNAADPREFFQLYSSDDANPRLPTAVRLSATFPYVSPICRPRRQPPDQRRDYHVADGGYVDNEGAYTVIDWIQSLFDHYRELEKKRPGTAKPFDRILVIRIRPFPIHSIRDAQTNSGWLYGAIGPLTTMMNVREASQAERIRKNLELLSKTPTDLLPEPEPNKRKQKSELRGQAELYKLRADLEKERAPATDSNYRQYAQMSQEAQQKAIELSRSLVDNAEVEVTWTTFVFDPAGANVPPMSWKLTRSQKQEIEDAWQKIKANKSDELTIRRNGLHESPLDTLDRFFPRAKKK